VIKRWMSIGVILAMILGGGYFYLSSGQKSAGGVKTEDRMGHKAIR